MLDMSGTEREARKLAKAYKPNLYVGQARAGRLRGSVHSFAAAGTSE